MPEGGSLFSSAAPVFGQTSTNLFTKEEDKNGGNNEEDDDDA